MPTKDLNYLFNEVSLYTKEKFSVFKLDNNKYEIDENQLSLYFEYIGCHCDKLVTYCHKCKKEFPFKIHENSHGFYNNYMTNEKSMIFTKPIFKEIYGVGNASKRGEINFKVGEIRGAMPPYNKEELLENQIWYIQYYFNCTHDDSHCYMMMVSIELKAGELIVRKIGQNPSMLTVKGFEFDKYKKQLEEINAYEDYKKADLSNADHFHVGAFAYLRRIFEKMINQYLVGMVLPDNHMDTKIKAVKDKFDPRVQDTLINLYGIISKSIHELDEEESKEYYEYLKAIIDMQLEYIKTELDKKKQSESLSNILNKIASKF